MAFSVNSDEISFDINPLRFIKSNSDFAAETLISKNDYDSLFSKSQQCWLNNANEKCFFYLQYAYLKLRSRDSIQTPIVTVSGNKLLIKSAEPLREISLDKIKLPLSFITHFHKNYFEVNLSTKQLNGLAPSQANYVLKIVNLAGQSHKVTISAQNGEKPKAIAKAISFNGMPCKNLCVRIYAEILKDLASNITGPVIDASNQQKVFNESILCDATVISDCDNRLINRDSNDVSFQALNNQWVVEFTGIEKHKSWFTSNILVAHYSALTEEKFLLTSLFVREKSEERVVKSLAEKTRTLIQLNL